MPPTNESTKKPKRRWLSFGLRGLMVLVLLLSLPMGWIARDVYRARRETEVVAAVEKAGGYVSYGYRNFSNWGETPEPPGPWLLRKVFGEHIHAYVTNVAIWEPEDVNTLVPMLGNCHRLETLELPAVTLSDQSVETIARLTMLQELKLSGTSITIEQMRTLSQTLNLKAITLHGPTASDDYLELLPKFTSLDFVSLSETKITDRGMQSLGLLPQLNWLNIEQAPAVTNAGFAALANSKKLTHMSAEGTKIDHGCIDTIKAIPALDDVYVGPDDLEVEFDELESTRLDTMTPVKVTAVFMPACGTCGIFPPDKTGPRVIAIERYHISVDRYDEDEIENLPTQ